MPEPCRTTRPESLGRSEGRVSTFGPDRSAPQCPRPPPRPRHCPAVVRAGITPGARTDYAEAKKEPARLLLADRFLARTRAWGSPRGAAPPSGSGIDAEAVEGDGNGAVDDRRAGEGPQADIATGRD